MQLHFHYLNTGFCQVHFKDKKTRAKYCIQEQFSKERAKKYGYDWFKLLVCSKDGEPSHEVSLENVELIHMPKGEDMEDRLVKNVVSFLNEKKVKMV